MNRPHAHFAHFDLDIRSGELSDGDSKVLLQPQPFEVLRILLEHGDELVTREEIRKKLWPNDTIVEFDHSINAAIKRLRQVLGDSASEPRFIETVARRGYRLKVHVNWVDPSLEMDSQAQSVQARPANLCNKKVADTTGSQTGKMFSHYRILDVLGGGGMGVVYRAEDIKLGRRVAVKFLPEELFQDRRALERFEREARAASALSHPNICTVHEIDEQNGIPFIVMELLHGETLAERLERGPLPISELLEIGTQISDGLGAAHAEGIIHRDIKPGNIFITKRGQAKILDFGLAKLCAQESGPQSDGPSGPLVVMSSAGASDALHTSSSSGRLSMTGATMGTAAYMSPEQVRGESLDARSDIFSFGAVLYEMANGRQAFQGDTIQTIREAILAQTSGLPIRDSTLHPELQTIIGKALHTKREDRYQAAEEIRADLLRIRGTERSAIYPAVRLSTRFRRAILVLVVGAVIVVVGLITSRVLSGHVQSGSELRELNITDLSSDPNLMSQALSPDGKAVAILESSDKGESIWLMTIGTPSMVQLVPPVPKSHGDLIFSPDGKYLYYAMSRSANLYFSKTRGSYIGADLYRLALPVGEPVKVLEDVFGFVAVDPTGNRVAFLRTSWTEEGKPDKSQLAIADLGTSEVHSLLSFSSPEFLWMSPSWSPDGRTLVTSVRQGKGYRLIAVDAQSQHWQWVGSTEWAHPIQTAWLHNGAGFLLSASQLYARDDPQIWYVAYPAGNIRKISDERFPKYRLVSVSQDDNSFLTASRQSESSLWTAPAAEPDLAKQITPVLKGNGEENTGLASTTDGSILYQVPHGHASDIWAMSADGLKNSPLISSAGFNSWPAACGDRYVVFQSDRSNGLFGIWRTNRDGSQATQLVSSDQQAQYPSCSPDGQWVVYSLGNDTSYITSTNSVGRSDASQHTIWRVPINGGAAQQLTFRGNSLRPVFSPDGRWIACFYGEDPTKAPLLAIIPSKGGAPVKFFDLQLIPTTGPGPIQWSPDGQYLTYVRGVSQFGEGNIWAEPITRGPAKALTHFKSNLVVQFAFSANGKQIVMRRMQNIADLLLVKNFR
jgi:serine/threonine protein kinase